MISALIKLDQKDIDKGSVGCDGRQYHTKKRRTRQRSELVIARAPYPPTHSAVRYRLCLYCEKSFNALCSRVDRPHPL